MRRLPALIILFAILTLAGCAATKDIIVAPGRVATTAAAGQPTEKWTFWVRKVVDERQGEFAGDPRIGKLGKRFDENQTIVHLDMLPDKYLKDQLNLFLLNTGMGASATEKARVFMDVTLTVFTVEVDKTSVLDKLDFSLDFDVKFYTPEGQYLGAVRLPEKRWIKLFSPFGSSQESLELLIRDTMASTFGLLAQSDVFKTASELK